jgi:hypothetical protein
MIRSAILKILVTCMALVRDGLQISAYPFPSPAGYCPNLSHRIPYLNRNLTGTQPMVESSPLSVILLLNQIQVAGYFKILAGTPSTQTLVKVLSNSGKYVLILLVKTAATQYSLHQLEPPSMTPTSFSSLNPLNEGEWYFFHMSLWIDLSNDIKLTFRICRPDPPLEALCSISEKETVNVLAGDIAGIFRILLGAQTSGTSGPEDFKGIFYNFLVEDTFRD